MKEKIKNLRSCYPDSLISLCLQCTSVHSVVLFIYLRFLCALCGKNQNKLVSIRVNSWLNKSTKKRNEANFNPNSPMSQMPKTASKPTNKRNTAHLENANNEKNKANSGPKYPLLVQPKIHDFAAKFVKIPLFDPASPKKKRTQFSPQVAP